MASRVLQSLCRAPLLVIMFMIILSIKTLANNETDSFSLLAFKSFISDHPSEGLSSWNNSLHFCQWQGVTCGRRHRRVVRLDLSSKGLVGSLSPYIGNLSFVREINLENNSFHGEIPPEIGRLYRLWSLQLANNSFDGRVPANLSNCERLEVLDARRNKLVGEIPSSIDALTKLRVIAVSYNKLSGEIPSSIGNHTSLEFLDLMENELEGRIPHYVGKLKYLVAIGFGGNKIHGTVPSSVYNLSSLKILSLSTNQLQGSLPPDIGQSLPNLLALELWENQFTGPIPLSLSNLSDLVTIDLSDNNFIGKIPSNFGNLERLQIFDLSVNMLGNGDVDDLRFLSCMSNWTVLELMSIDGNGLGGFLPNQIGNLSAQLRFFGVAANQISGVIPSDLVNLAKLDILQMQANQIAGHIPDDIGKMKNLQILELEENQLSGSIPSSVGNISLLSRMHLGNNKLEGTIPPSLGNSRYLIVLDLKHNNLSGLIPIKLFSASALSLALNLAGNQLVGPLPSEVGSLQNLAELDVSENLLSGEVPKALGSCLALVNLNMGGNSFQGSIPDTWASLRGIGNLNLSHNNLSGLLPKFLENPSLKTLDLSFNDFVGELPTQGVFRNASAISVLGNHRLCGGISELGLPRCNGITSKKRWPIIVIATVCSLLCIALLSSFMFFWLKKRRKVLSSAGSLLEEKFLQVSYRQLLKATNGFSSANFIGMGSFGSVYKGVIESVEAVVAVKVLNLQHQGASKSFMAECEAMRNIRHRNLVKIMTTCSSMDHQGHDFKALVYEFMENGSLESWLHSTQVEDMQQDEPKTLKLHQRVNIAIDVACAVDYLHRHCELPIIHCDLKPSNVLLDNDMVAHVGDFGLARFLLPKLSTANESSSLGINGTIGYVAPEYGLGSEVSTAGDVYSYGIMLLEIMTGKRPTDPTFQEGLNLDNFARRSMPDHVMEIVDPSILANDQEVVAVEASAREDQKRKEECLISIIKIGLACSVESPHDRVEMSSVINELNLIRDILQEIDI